MEKPASTPTMASFSGRAVPTEMASVRLGGSGRPVKILPRSSDVRNDTRREPRVVLEPQPRSPFRRKLDTPTSVVPPIEESLTQPFKVDTILTEPPQRVHTLHHPTHRTPLAVALHHTNTGTASTILKKKEPLRESRRPMDSAHQTDNTLTRHEAHTNSPTNSIHPNPNGSVAISARLANLLQPHEVSLFTQKPSLGSNSVGRHSFHCHERVLQDSTADGIEEERAQSSGWRKVDDMIDCIYEDPSVDTVQLHLLAQGNRRNIKKKAVERERLHLAAVEIQKVKQEQLEKKHEITERRNLMLKISNEIRDRNRSVAKRATTGHASPILQECNRQQIENSNPTRKPPVPRLSRISGKQNKTKTQKAAATSRQSDSLDGAEILPVEVEDARVGAHGQHVSESILTGSKQASSKHSKVSKLKSSGASARAIELKRTSSALKEKLQRRAVAREYMETQKHTRQLLRAKMNKRKLHEEEHRRLELQRLEEDRLAGLEEARKRRVRQEQRERICQRTRRQKQIDVDTVEKKTPATSNEPSTDQIYVRNSLDSENHSDVGNCYPECKSGRRLEVESHSSMSSPELTQALPEEGTVSKLQKLLDLEKQANALASKLISLSQPPKNRPSVEVQEDTDSLSVAHKRFYDDKNAHDVENQNQQDRGRNDDQLDKALSDKDSGDQGNDERSGTQAAGEDIIFLTSNCADGVCDDFEVDYSSVGIQRIQVVWSLGRYSSTEEKDKPFIEALAPSEADSEPLSHSSTPVTRRNDEEGQWFNHHHSSRIPFNESVMMFPQGSQHQSSEIEENYQNENLEDGAQKIEPNFSLEGNGIPCRRKRRYRTSADPDAELLRLIRESDDNLSVIDREAKRRFRLQQEMLRKRRGEQERLDGELLHARLLEAKELNNAAAVRLHVEQEEEEWLHGVKNRESDIRAHAQIRHDTLDEILEAVRTELTDPNVDKQDQYGDVDESPVHTNAVGLIAFWDSQLQPLRTSPPQRPFVEIDRADIKHNEQQQLNVEVEDDESESSHSRLLSPHSLAVRLLAAIEYHEAIHDAHCQLSLMENAHAFDQVQQESIALAHAFKTEVDQNYLVQQISNEHATLEKEFDINFSRAVHQLEAVRQEEEVHRLSQITRLEGELVAARKRESAVQTDARSVADATTYARLQVEACVETDVEHSDAIVQYSPRMDLVTALARNVVSENVDKLNSTDDYASNYADWNCSSSSVRNSQVLDLDSAEEDNTHEGNSTHRLDGDISDDIVEPDVKEVSDSSGHDSVDIIDDMNSIEEQAISSSDRDGGMLKQAKLKSESGSDDYEDEVFEEENHPKRGPESVASQISETDHAVNSDIQGSFSRTHSGDDVDSSYGYKEESETEHSHDSPPQVQLEEAYSSDREIEEESGEAQSSPTASFGVHCSISSGGVELQNHTTPGDRSKTTICYDVPLHEHSSPASTFVVETTRLADFTAISSDIGHAYIQQLENRKESEHALLDIRLRALENKLQQDLCHLTQKIGVDCANADREKELLELELHRDALHMMYMSEKANIESERASCVSRYFQDLLAFRALGISPTAAPAQHHIATGRPGIERLNSRNLCSETPPNRDVMSAEETQIKTIGFEERAVAVPSSPSIEDSDKGVHLRVEKVMTDDEEAIDIDSDVDTNSAAAEIRNSTMTEDVSITDYNDDQFESIVEPGAEEIVQAEVLGSVSSSMSVKSEHNADDAEILVGDSEEEMYEDEFASASQSISVGEDASTPGEQATEKVSSDSILLDEFVSNITDQVILTDDIVEDEREQTNYGSLDDSHTDIPKAPAGDAIKENNYEAGSGHEVYEDEFPSVSETEEMDKSTTRQNEVEEAEEVQSERRSNLAGAGNLGETGDLEDLYADDDFDESQSGTIPPEIDPSNKAREQSLRDLVLEEDAYSVEFEDGEVRPDAEPMASAGQEEASDILNIATRESYPGAELSTPLLADDVNILPCNAEAAWSPANGNSTPKSLLGSLSESHLEDTLTTASMEEQLKRIDNLKHQLQLRREAFTELQRRLRVEKKKEKLRESETQLWMEMEQLEEQLIADERILALTNERGRLEALELAARHDYFIRRDEAGQDLLANYDYSEEVEQTHYLVEKKDHEVQVRISIQGERAPQSRECRGESDSLIAFDYVELAECPVVTVGTSTDLGFTEVPMKGGTGRCETKYSDQPELLPDEQTRIHCRNEGITGDKLELNPSEYSALVVPRTQISSSNSDRSIDHLVDYEYIEDAELPLLSIDMLEGYDHIEEVEIAHSFPAHRTIDRDGDRHRHHATEVSIELAALMTTPTQENLTKSMDVDPRNLKLGGEHTEDSNDSSANIQSIHVPDVSAQTRVDLSDRYGSIESFEGTMLFRSTLREDILEKGDLDDLETQPIGNDEVKANLGLFSDVNRQVELVSDTIWKVLLCGAVSDGVHACNRIAGLMENRAMTGNVNERSPQPRDTPHQTDGFAIEAHELLASNSDRDSDENVSDFAENSTSHDRSRTIQVDLTKIDHVIDKISKGLVAEATQNGVRILSRKSMSLRSQYPLPIHLSGTSEYTDSKFLARLTQDENNSMFGRMIIGKLLFSPGGVILSNFDENGNIMEAMPRAAAIGDAVVEAAQFQYDRTRQISFFDAEMDTSSQRRTLSELIEEDLAQSLWKSHSEKMEARSLIYRRLQEHERDKLDGCCVQIVLDQQRLGVTNALSRFHELSSTRDAASVDNVTAPRHQRRSSSKRGSNRGLSSQLLHAEENGLVDRITERLMQFLYP